MGRQIPPRGILIGPNWRSGGKRSGARGRACIGAGRVHDLGDPVGPDPGLRPVGGGAGRRAPIDRRGTAGRRPAPDPRRRGGTRRRVLVVFVCRGGLGPVTVSQRRQLHRSHGLRNRLDESGGGVGHHPGPADGLAVHRSGVRRRPADDRVSGGVVPAVRALETHRRGPSTGRSGAGRVDGRPCGHGHVGARRRFVLAAAVVGGGFHLGLPCVRHGMGRDPSRSHPGPADRRRYRGMGARIVLAALLFR